MFSYCLRSQPGEVVNKTLTSVGRLNCIVALSSYSYDKGDYCEARF